jgi:hypothetical protein
MNLPRNWLELNDRAKMLFTKKPGDDHLLIIPATPLNCNFHIFTKIVAMLRLAVVDDLIDLNLGAPKAVMNFLIGYKFAQIQLSPSMQSDPAE